MRCERNLIIVLLVKYSIRLDCHAKTNGHFAYVHKMVRNEMVWILDIITSLH